MRVSDALPAGLTLVRATRPARVRNGVVSMSVGTIAPGGSVTVGLVTRRPGVRGGVVRNTALAHGANTAQARGTARVVVVPRPGRVLPQVTG